LFDPIGPDDRPAPSAKSSAPPSTTEEKDILSPTPSTTSRSSRDRILYEDSSLRVWFGAKVNESSKSSCLVTVEFIPIGKKEKDKEKKKDKDKESSALKSIKLRISNPSKVKISGFKGNKGTLTEKGAEISFSNVKADDIVRETFQVDWSSPITAPLKIQAKLSYKDKKGKGKSKKECEMNIPLSTFIIPKKVTPSELAEIVKKSNNKANRRIEIKRPVRDVLQQVIPTLQVTLVEAVAFVAQYYGHWSPDSSHVVVRVQATKGDNSGVDATVRATSESLAEALFEELTVALQS